MKAESITPEKSIVIFVHGFMGSPRVFNYLASQIKGCGYDTGFITLPGHDDTIYNFFKTPSRLWSLCVD